MGFLFNAKTAAHSLRRSKRFSLAVIATLATGLGVSNTLFGLIDRLLFRPPPHVTALDRIVRLGLAEKRGFMGQPISMPLSGVDYDMLRRYARGFVGVAAYARVTESLGRGLDATMISVAFVSASYFDVPGVTPALGRFFRDEEDEVGATLIPCIASEPFWRHNSAAILRLWDSSYSWALSGAFWSE
jgi:hypothetical protein